MSSSSSSSSCGYQYDTFGRQGIGVVQPQSGVDFPLIGVPSEDIRYLLADMWLIYDDPYDYCPDDYPEPFQRPFHVKWLYGPGCINNSNPAWAPTPTHAADILIVDDNDRILFDSTTAPDFLSKPWGDRLHVYIWEKPEDYIRASIVVHTKWNSIDDTIAVPREYDKYLAPEHATIDARCVERRPKRVRSFTVVLDEITRCGVEFVEGYNMEIIHTGEVLRDNRVIQQVSMAAIPGAGLGIYPGCPPEPLVIRRINEIRPTDPGDFYMAATDCYYVRRPTTLLSTDPRITEPEAAMLQLGNDCIPCCPCEDYVAVAEYMNRVRDRYWLTGRKAEDTRDLYHENRERWLERSCCFEARKLRLSLQPQLCPHLDVVAQFCNDTDECVENLELTIDFEQIVFASNSAEGNPVPGFTFAKGVDQQPGRRSGSTSRYNLEGAWPQFKAFWEYVEPYQDVWVKFRLKFNQCGTDSEDQPFIIKGCLTGTIDGEPITVSERCAEYLAGSAESLGSSESAGEQVPIEVCKEATLRCPAGKDDTYNYMECAQ